MKTESPEAATVLVRVIGIDTSLEPKTALKDKPIWAQIDPDLDKGLPVIADAPGDVHHLNYLEYLEICWANHLCPVLSPDILWFMLLNELAGIIRDDPEKVRAIFSTSAEKQEIIVPTDSPVVLPLDLISEELHRRIPGGIERYMPKFSTDTPRSVFARQAAFADAVSPFYDYGMLLCGFPAVVVWGDDTDWDNLKTAWSMMPQEILHSKSIERWHSKVSSRLMRLAENVVGEVGEMFTLERCGSGSQVVISGWISEFFRRRPSLAYSSNFASHVAKVDYRELGADRHFTMFAGLFGSTKRVIEGGLVAMIPDYGYVVFERKP